MIARRGWMMAAAASGLIGVIAGAFGAHGTASAIAREWLRTGSTYELIHAAAAFSCAALPARGGLPAGLFLLGTVLFSGSLYALALGAPVAFAMAAPVGGLLLMAGWAALIWAAAGAKPMNGA